MRAINIRCGARKWGQRTGPIVVYAINLKTCQAASFFSFFFSSFDASVRLKPFFIASLEKTSDSFSSSVALLYFARQFLQQKPTWAVPTSTSVSLFTDFPVNGQATCLI